MTLTRLALRSLTFYRRTNTASVLGVASAVAVLAGALLVGSSVRASLSGIAASRLGRTSVVLTSENLFTESLSTRLLPGRTIAAPILMFKGVALHDTSGRRARDVQIYGIDERFFAFHGVEVKAPDRSDALLSPDLADELGAAAGDSLLVRVARPTDIPLDSLHGRREDVGRSVRLQVASTLPRDKMGEFSLMPQQGRARAVFVSLARLQHDVDPPPAGDVTGAPVADPPRRVNALLLTAPSGEPLDAATVRTALASAIGPGDLGLKVSMFPQAETASSRGPAGVPTLLVETSSGVMSDQLAGAVAAAARRASLHPARVLTWLANRMTIGDRSVPYSLVTAIDSGAAADSDLRRLIPSSAGGPLRPGSTPIVLNEWAARDLRAMPGQALEMEYYRWLDEGRLTTARATFQVAGVVPMSGLGADRRLAPDYPGITSSNSVSDWDPPFPIDLTLVRPIDEDYWRKFRTAPKAFIPIEAGQALWGTRHGQLTSMRLRPAKVGAALDSDVASRLAVEITREIPPDRAGFTVIDVRNEVAAAAVGATDFGAYFSYFSFFLMVSALLLAALFFRLGIEQRLTQAGILRATGFSIAALRRLFLIEGGLISIAGGIAGVALAVGWAALMMYGLRTWWIGAVGTTLLRLHLDPAALVMGAAGAVAAAIVSIAITVRGLARPTPRALLAGSPSEMAARRARGVPAHHAAIACFVLATLLSVLSITGAIPPAAGFFGAGTLVLSAGLFAFSAWLRHLSSDRLSNFGRKSPSLFRLALTNASWRPGRSLTSAGLVAAAVFLLVSVDAFRKGAASNVGPASGTGGFALIAESSLPIVHDVSTFEGRAALGLESTAGDRPLDGVTLLPLRLRPGDDTSCLNLYQPRRPRIVGVPPRVVDAGRFRFATSLASTAADRANPWRLLGPADPDGIVPGIVDQTSLQYVLHASVGDVLTLDADTTRPIRLRVVASLDDSMLQGEILIAERAFVDLFPDVEGYRIVLADIPNASAVRVDEVARLLEDGLEPFGLDAEDSVKRLEAYHRVENTYLSTFQALGGLGLVLGCFGLIAITARNVLERRRELALLGAAGFRGSQLQALVVAETSALIVAGLLVGVVAALVAIGPVLLSRRTPPSTLPLVALGLVAVVGVVAAIGATRSVRRLPLVASLRSE
ncbi:MAG TPA: FtsX-like permease family protein [Vicinamibacterales bacterium]|nr:FtsX-like permease family protein [Vicinamibacterales bacterium]